MSSDRRRSFGRPVAPRPQLPEEVYQPEPTDAARSSDRRIAVGPSGPIPVLPTFVGLVPVDLNGYVLESEDGEAGSVRIRIFAATMTSDGDVVYVGADESGETVRVGHERVRVYPDGFARAVLEE